MTDHAAPVAILLASTGASLAGAARLGPRALLPLTDKPLLQLGTEALVRCGCREFHVFLDETPEKIRDFLGNGERWGITLTYHYFDGSQTLLQNLKRLKLAGERRCWIASDSVAPASLLFGPVASEPPLDTLYVQRIGGQATWSGWACLAAGQLAHLGGLEQPGDALGDDLQAALTEDRLLDIRSDAGFLDSCQAALEQQAASGRAIRRPARRASIHPSAQLLAPVHIGENARIESGAIVGPYAVIGANACIDQSAEIRDSVVLAETYVGQGLLLEHAIAGRNKLISIRNATVLDRIEPHLIAATRPASQRPPLSESAMLVLLQVLMLPLWLLARAALRLAAGPRPTRRSILLPRLDGGATAGAAELPLAALTDYETESHTQWLAHFAHTFYPGLQAVRQGKLSLFGLQLRDRSELAALPQDWRELYARSRCGLLNEAMQHAGPLVADSPLRYASDLCAATGMSAGLRRRIFFKYLACLLGDFMSLFRMIFPARAKSELSSHP